MEESYAVERDEFPESVSEDVDGLLWLGYLDYAFDYCGHEFVIRTLKTEEQLLCGLIVKEYNETLSQGKAWVAAQVAMALVSVDGEEEFCPKAGFNKRDNARARFNYVISNWYDPTIVEIYNQYLNLVERQALALVYQSSSSKAFLNFLVIKVNRCVAFTSPIVIMKKFFHLN